MVRKVSRLPAVAFVGRQNSGKTTLLEKLIVSLCARKVRVATLKHHSHTGFDIDIEGKDSYRHAKAGSLYTAVASPDKLACVQRLDAELGATEIAQMIANNATRTGLELQILLVEGYRHCGFPTIELFRANNPKDEARELGTDGNEIIAVVTNMTRIVEAAANQGLPCFDIDDIEPLADFVCKTFISQNN